MVTGWKGSKPNLASNSDNTYDNSLRRKGRNSSFTSSKNANKPKLKEFFPPPTTAAIINGDDLGLQNNKDSIVEEDEEQVQAEVGEGGASTTITSASASASASSLLSQQEREERKKQLKNKWNLMTAGGVPATMVSSPALSPSSSVILSPNSSCASMMASPTSPLASTHHGQQLLRKQLLQDKWNTLTGGDALAISNRSSLSNSNNHPPPSSPLVTSVLQHLQQPSLFPPLAFPSSPSQQQQQRNSMISDPKSNDTPSVGKPVVHDSLLGSSMSSISTPSHLYRKGQQQQDTNSDHKDNITTVSEEEEQLMGGGASTKKKRNWMKRLSLTSLPHSKSSTAVNHNAATVNDLDDPSKMVSSSSRKRLSSLKLFVMASSPKDAAASPAGGTAEGGGGLTSRKSSFFGNLRRKTASKVEMASNGVANTTDGTRKNEDWQQR